jgi:hypothetical protein
VELLPGHASVVDDERPGLAAETRPGFDDEVAREGAGVVRAGQQATAWFVARVNVCFAARKVADFVLAETLHWDWDLCRKSEQYHALRLLMKTF